MHSYLHLNNAPTGLRARPTNADDHRMYCPTRSPSSPSSSPRTPIRSSNPTPVCTLSPSPSNPASAIAAATSAHAPTPAPPAPVPAPALATTPTPTSTSTPTATELSPPSDPPSVPFALRHKPRVGDVLHVRWDDRWQVFRGVVVALVHRRFVYRIQYDDGDVSTHDLDAMTFKYESEAAWYNPGDLDCVPSDCDDDGDDGENELRSSRSAKKKTPTRAKGRRASGVGKNKSKKERKSPSAAVASPAEGGEIGEKHCETTKKRKKSQSLISPPQVTPGSMSKNQTKKRKVDSNIIPTPAPHSAPAPAKRFTGVHVPFPRLAAVEKGNFTMGTPISGRRRHRLPNSSLTPPAAVGEKRRIGYPESSSSPSPSPSGPGRNATSPAHRLTFAGKRPIGRYKVSPSSSGGNSSSPARRPSFAGKQPITALPLRILPAVSGYRSGSRSAESSEAAATDADAQSPVDGVCGTELKVRLSMPTRLGPSPETMTAATTTSIIATVSGQGLGMGPVMEGATTNENAAVGNVRVDDEEDIDLEYCPVEPSSHSRRRSRSKLNRLSRSIGEDVVTALERARVGTETESGTRAQEGERDEGEVDVNEGCTVDGDDDSDGEIMRHVKPSILAPLANRKQLRHKCNDAVAMTERLRMPPLTLSAPCPDPTTAATLTVFHAVPPAAQLNDGGHDGLAARSEKRTAGLPSVRAWNRGASSEGDRSALVKRLADAWTLCRQRGIPLRKRVRSTCSVAKPVGDVQ